MQRDFTESVRKLIESEDLFRGGDHIVVGLSGGPDSISLIDFLFTLSKEMDLTLSAVHLNHMFRPGDAERDEEYCRHFCLERNIAFRSKVVDVNKMAMDLKLTSEEAGRKARYNLFDDEAMSILERGLEKENIKIALAHNLNDQAETLLMRLLRGTGVDGLAGIPIKRLSKRGFMIIRPLIYTAREDIEAYCHDNELNPRIDKTNEQAVYKRNEIRLDLIPFIEERYNPNIIETLVRLSRAASEDKEYFETISDRFISENLEQDRFISTEALKELPPSIRRRVIKRVFFKLGLESDITEKHLKAADRILQAQVGKYIEFPASYRMRVLYDKVEFYNESDIEERSETKKVEPYIKLRYETVDKLMDGDIAFDADAIKGKIELRNRKKGDFIKLEVGTKKLKDFMIDQKIPHGMRDTISLVTVGSEVIWIPGKRVGASYKVKENTKNIVIVEYREENKTN